MGIIPVEVTVLREKGKRSGLRKLSWGLNQVPPVLQIFLPCNFTPRCSVPLAEPPASASSNFQVCLVPSEDTMTWTLRKN